MSDLKAARERVSFDVEKLTYVLDGGVEWTSQRRTFLRILEQEDLFANRDDIFDDRKARYIKAIARSRKLKEIQLSLGIIDDKRAWAQLKECAAFDDPTTLHELMFVPNIQALFTSEQQKEWIPRCNDWRIIGCYAQTEVGHGSNVRGIETTASYLQESDEFLLDSPTLSSTKFWPGSLGKTANTAMLIARLVTPDGVDRGPHNFIVPIRDSINHMPLPGVFIGDIGPKIGFNNMDNGFLRLSKVKIPRRNMAARFSSVSSSGKYVLTSDKTTKKIAGLTMTQVRAHIVQMAGRALASACCIAIRYSCVRRQGFTATGDNEHFVLHYMTQVRNVIDA
jgi:acyl-CoA oxidase